MNINPDPRPGRWMLPLVVLGMVTFTWVFVNQLPGDPDLATPEQQPDDSGTTSSTAVPDGTEDDDTAESPDDTGGGGDTPVTPEVQAYLDAMTAFGTQLTTFQVEMATVNAGWDADPKELSLSETEQRLTTLASDVDAWAQQVAAVEPPPEMASAHQNMVVAAQAAATEAANVLDGLVNSPTAEARRSAVTRFDEAVSAYQDALTAAGG